MDTRDAAVGTFERAEHSQVGDGWTGHGDVNTARSVEEQKGQHLRLATSATAVDATAADLVAELKVLKEELVRLEAERMRLTEALDLLTVERDAARLDAETHADSARAVFEVMEKLVQQLRDELEHVRRSADGSRDAVCQDLSRQRNDLQSRLAEIEGSRAWRAVSAYRGVRLRLSPRS